MLAVAAAARRCASAISRSSAWRSAAWAPSVRGMAVAPSADTRISLNLGVEFPDFQVKTTHGDMGLHSFFEDSWTILFSHPRDFTPVCTTELGEIAKLQPEFEARGVKLLALSCDSVEDHESWKCDIEAARGTPVTYPIIDDSQRHLSVALGFLDPDEKDMDGLPVPVRAVVIVGPDKKVKLTITYPPSVGRNTAELLRVVDALQLGAAFPVATPVNWQPGDDVMITPGVTPEQAAEQFPGHKVVDVPSGKAYLRTTSPPQHK